MPRQASEGLWSTVGSLMGFQRPEPPPKTLSDKIKKFMQEHRAASWMIGVSLLVVVGVGVEAYKHRSQQLALTHQWDANVEAHWSAFEHNIESMHGAMYQLERSLKATSEVSLRTADTDRHPALDSVEPAQKGCDPEGCTLQRLITDSGRLIAQEIKLLRTNIGTRAAGRASRLEPADMVSSINHLLYSARSLVNKTHELSQQIQFLSQATPENLLSNRPTVSCAGSQKDNCASVVTKGVQATAHYSDGAKQWRMSKRLRCTLTRVIDAGNWGMLRMADLQACLHMPPLSPAADQHITMDAGVAANGGTTEQPGHRLGNQQSGPQAMPRAGPHQPGAQTTGEAAYSTSEHLISVQWKDMADASRTILDLSAFCGQVELVGWIVTLHDAVAQPTTDSQSGLSSAHDHNGMDKESMDTAIRLVLDQYVHTERARRPITTALHDFGTYLIRIPDPQRALHTGIALPWWIVRNILYYTVAEWLETLCDYIVPTNVQQLQLILSTQSAHATGRVGDFLVTAFVVVVCVLVVLATVRGKLATSTVYGVLSIILAIMAFGLIASLLFDGLMLIGGLLLVAVSRAPSVSHDLVERCSSQDTSLTQECAALFDACITDALGRLVK